MNNSDQPLTPFEEKLTAYLDRKLSAEEATALEREHPEVVAERLAQDRLHKTLLLGSPVPALRNGEFFNRQILREVASSMAQVAEPARAETKASLFSIWRLVFAGAACLLVAVGIYQGLVPKRQAAPAYFAQVLSVKTGDDSLKARLVNEEGMTVVMIDGLDPIDEDFILN
jgi:hypothetical protein